MKTIEDIVLTGKSLPKGFETKCSEGLNTGKKIQKKIFETLVDESEFSKKTIEKSTMF